MHCTGRLHQYKFTWHNSKKVCYSKSLSLDQFGTIAVFRNSFNCWGVHSDITAFAVCELTSPTTPFFLCVDDLAKLMLTTGAALSTKLNWWLSSHTVLAVFPDSWKQDLGLGWLKERLSTGVPAETGFHWHVIYVDDVSWSQYFTSTQNTSAATWLQALPRL